MAIVFNCESCKSKIKAPDEAGGKWGSCPKCKHRCYIPLPKSDDEPELRLQPLDESEETRIGQMMRETHSLTQKILHQRDIPKDEPDLTPNDFDKKNILKAVILYLRQMADGELGGAEKSLANMKRFKRETKQVLSGMANADRPEPELSDIAKPVLQAFIKELNSKL